MLGLVVGSGAFGALATVLVATACGRPSDALPGVEASGGLLVFVLVGLGAFGFTQGGSRQPL